MNFAFPTLATLAVTQKWGNVNVSMYPAPSYRHMGLDIGGPVGASIYAAADGIVETSSLVNLHGYGRHIIIQHDGFKTLYAHLHKVIAIVGQAVVGGQQIGEMGGQPGDNDPIDGASTGSHLHFELILPSQPNFDFVKTWAGYTVDPLDYLTRLAFGEPKMTVKVLANKGLRVRNEPSASGLQIGALGTMTTHPIIELVDSGRDQWARLWSLREEYAAVKYQGEMLMSVSAGTGGVEPPPPYVPPTLDEIVIRHDEIDRMMAYLQFRRNEL